VLPQGPHSSRNSSRYELRLTLSFSRAASAASVCRPSLDVYQHVVAERHFSSPLPYRKWVPAEESRQTLSHGTRVLDMQQVRRVGEDEGLDVWQPSE
jgi:hypothetical protein